MKIRLSELKKIIKEEVESAAAYKRWKEMSAIHTSSPDHKMARMAMYNYFNNDLPKLFDLKSSAPGYYDFFNQVKRSGLNYPASSISDFYNSSFTTPEELQVAAKEFEELQDRFEETEVSDQTDAMYGRKSYQVVDKKSGEVVDRYKDRRGSLGT